MSLNIKSLLSLSLGAESLTKGRFVTRPPAIVVPSRRSDSRADEIAVISHELRNSLGVVRNAARLLRSPVGASGIDSARVLIERHVGQMNRHVEDLLDAAHPGGRTKVLRLSHVDLRTIVEQAVNAIASDLARRGHRLVMNLPADALWVHADTARLEQVFSNLLINAAKYTPDGGDIVVTMERRDTHASICVRDSGIGIDPAVLPGVFDMFAQADAAAPCAEGGSGIGLAVVRNVVELHGGSVRAASAGLGQGSEFTVLLPVLWARLDTQSPESSTR
jgi:signal transduction histidine kinase